MLIRRLAVVAWNQRKEPSYNEEWNAQHATGTRAEWDALTRVAADLWGLEKWNCHKLTAAEVWAAGHTVVYGKTLESSKRMKHR